MSERLSSHAAQQRIPYIKEAEKIATVAESDLNGPYKYGVSRLHREPW